MLTTSFRKIFLSIAMTILASLSAFSQQTLWVGQSYTFDVTSSVMGITANMSWSTNGGYLSLSGSGFYRTITVTQYFSGTATVTCEWDYKLTGNGSYTHTKRQVTISCRDNQVSISPSSLTLQPGESGYVSYHHQYDNQYTSAANAYFQSSDPSICTVSSSGEVVAKNPGTTYINVYSKISSVSPYCRVTVKQIEPTSVSLPSSIAMTAGETRTINATLYPSNAQSSFSWTSSDTQVASVSSSGIVTAKKHGTAIITVKTSNGLSASTTLTVNKAKLKLEPSIGEGLYQSGQTIFLTANASDAKIYYTIDGSQPTVNSILYSTNIILENPITLKAIAIHDDYENSDIITVKYDVTSLKVEELSPNSEINYLPSICYPTVTFNEAIDADIMLSKIHCKFKGHDIPFQAYVLDKSLTIVPDTEEYSDGGIIYISIEEYCIYNQNKQPNTSIILSGYINPVNTKYTSYPIKVYAGAYASIYITNDYNLNTFGGWPTSNGWTYYKTYSFENAVSSCKSESIVPFIDTDSNLWVAGTNSYFFPFQEQPIIYRSNVRECAYADEATLFYVTQDNQLYGVGSDRFLQLMGKGNKRIQTSYETMYYADTPIRLMDNVLHVYADDRNCAVIKTDNSLWTWGCIYANGKYESIGTPFKIADNVRQASIGNEKPCTFVCFDDTAWYVESTTKKVIKIADNVKFIIGGDERGFYITNDGKLYGWGRNDKGQLGNGAINDYPYLLPTQAVHIMDDIIDVSCGWDYTLALTSNYEIYGWGRNGCERFYKSKSTNYNQIEPLLLFSPESRLNIRNVNLPQSITAYVGYEIVIPINVEPSNGSCKSYEWSTSDKSVATISSNGVVTPIEEGECTIFLTITDFDNNIINEEVALKVRPELEAGIETNLCTNDNKLVDVYNLQGICLKRNSTQDEINNLPSGLYIIGGKKVLIK